MPPTRHPTSLIWQVLRGLTDFLGGPVLPSVEQLPEANAHRGHEKVRTIGCATRRQLERLYRPWNELLQEWVDGGAGAVGATEEEPGRQEQQLLLLQEEEDGVERPPPQEPPFRRFAQESSVACEDSD